MSEATDQPIKPTQPLEAGTRVRVTQQIQHKKWNATIEGRIVRYEQSKTGSWYAHAKDDKLWLDRLVLEKDDGEIVVCNLDPYTHIEAVG